ncbi:choline kinase family protein [Nakamurella sp. PAMC28650]|uniref:choline kinase family protein n=1 Tax=Nakamurella sp. PAMC28650 TaxID=2762325 RepID=UPI00164EC571|nr:choline/ethanolamine kinase family protein [Nakamurella sp. PAMC28650]QNK81245.1 phosphotransferase [Nakamurella sp. PAMC28650]
MLSESSDIFALTVSERLDMVAALRDPNRLVEPLPGGLTNENFKVTTATGTYVARLSRPSSHLLGIDRDGEYRNSLAAADSGVAPAVVAYAPEAAVLSIEWLEGRTLTAADLGSTEVLRSVAESCRALHSGPSFSADFDMFDVSNRYLDTIMARGFRLPDRYLDFTPAWDRIRTVLSMDAPAAVPCHNDLLAANFIDDGARLWLIDYEYAGNNDPCFELGNMWSEANLGDAELVVLVDFYYGEHRPDMVARARLQALVSQYGWTLWGAIQQSVSSLDFDFWAWSMEKYERAVSTFEGPHFADLLGAVATGPRTAPTATEFRSTTEKEKSQ